MEGLDYRGSLDLRLPNTPNPFGFLTSVFFSDRTKTKTAPAKHSGPRRERLQSGVLTFYHKHELCDVCCPVLTFVNDVLTITVRFIGTCLDGGVVNIFMEYVPGGSIASILAQ